MKGHPSEPPSTIEIVAKVWALILGIWLYLLLWPFLLRRLLPVLLPARHGNH